MVDYSRFVQATGAVIPAPQELQYTYGSYLAVIEGSGRPKNYQYIYLHPWKTHNDELIGYVGSTVDKHELHCLCWTDNGWTRITSKNKPPFGLETMMQQGITHITSSVKAQAFLAKAMPASPCLTWIGNDAIWQYTDWSMVKGQVTLIPAKAEASALAMKKLAAQLSKNNCSVCILKPPETEDVYWEISDVETDVEDFIRDNIPSQEEIKEKEDKGLTALDKYINPRGYDGKKVYLLPSGRQQVLEFDSTVMTKGILRVLAPTDLWASVFPKDSISDPVNWDVAGEWVNRQCEKRGVFNPSNIRGNGVWLDNKTQIVVHMGDHLLVDNERVELNHYKSKYIYAQRPCKLQFPQFKISREEKATIVKIAESFNWEDGWSSTALLSFIIVSPIAASLHWRPSIWLNGSAGTGKSTIQDKFVKRCLGDLQIHLEGDTTEAGIRQLIGCDSLPILFDEPEADSHKSVEKIRDVVKFIRSNASGSTGRTAKGSANGTATLYQAQCMFMLASINTIVLDPADRDRISILELRSDKSKEAQDRFKEVERMLANLPDDIGEKILQFVISHADWILNTIKAFCEYATNETNWRRSGDQYGILSIGRYILMNEIGRVPGKEEIAAYVDETLWKNVKVNDQQTNQKDFISYVAGIIINFEDADSKRKELSLREAFRISNDGPWSHIEPMQGNVRAALNRRGLHAKDDTVYFEKRSYNIQELLGKKPQFANYASILNRIPEAKEVRVRMSGKQVTAIAVPLELFTGDDILDPVQLTIEPEGNLIEGNDIVAW